MCFGVRICSITVCMLVTLYTCRGLFFQQQKKCSRLRRYRTRYLYYHVAVACLLLLVALGRGFAFALRKNVRPLFVCVCPSCLRGGAPGSCWSCRGRRPSRQIEIFHTRGGVAVPPQTSALKEYRYVNFFFFLRRGHSSLVGHEQHKTRAESAV